MAQITVAQAMGRPPGPLCADDALRDIVARFAADRIDSLRVVDHHSALLGVVTAVDVERAVSEPSDYATVAAGLVRDTPRLHPHDSLKDDEMIGRLTHAGCCVPTAGEPTPTR